MFPGFTGGSWKRSEGKIGATCLVLPSPVPKAMWQPASRAWVLGHKMLPAWEGHTSQVSIMVPVEGWAPNDKMMAGVWLGAIAQEWGLGSYRLEVDRDARFVCPLVTNLSPALATTSVELEGAEDKAWVSFRGVADLLGHDIAMAFAHKDEIAPAIDHVAAMAMYLLESGVRFAVGETVEGRGGATWRVEASPWGRVRPRVWALTPVQKP
jgi:hypothetical protein